MYLLSCCWFGLQQLTITVCLTALSTLHFSSFSALPHPFHQLYIFFLLSPLLPLPFSSSLDPSTPFHLLLLPHHYSSFNAHLSKAAEFPSTTVLFCRQLIESLSSSNGSVRISWAQETRWIDRERKRDRERRTKRQRHTQRSWDRKRSNEKRERHTRAFYLSLRNSQNSSTTDTASQLPYGPTDAMPLRASLCHHETIVSL